MNKNSPEVQPIIREFAHLAKATVHQKYIRAERRYNFYRVLLYASILIPVVGLIARWLFGLKTGLLILLLGLWWYLMSREREERTSWEVARNVKITYDAYMSYGQYDNALKEALLHMPKHEVVTFVEALGRAGAGVSSLRDAILFLVEDHDRDSESLMLDVIARMRS